MATAATWKRSLHRLPGLALFLAASVFLFSFPLARGLGGFDNATGFVNDEATNCTEPPESPFINCPHPIICEDHFNPNRTNGHENVGLAFGLTIGAGLSTTLGALLPFIPFIKRANTVYLAAGLGLAAGVMLYVSFTEIWTESNINFCCETPLHYELAATLCFFGGIFLTIVIDIVVWGLEKLDCGFNCCPARLKRLKKSVRIGRREKKTPASATNVLSDLKKDTKVCHLDESNDDSGFAIDQLTDGSSKSESSTLSTPDEGDHFNSSEGISTGVDVEAPEIEPVNLAVEAVVVIVDTPDLASKDEVDGPLAHREIVEQKYEEEKNDEEQKNDEEEKIDEEEESFTPLGSAEFKEVTDVVIPDKRRLHRMGLLTCIAIALHNFPEGLATFVATLSSPSLGVSLAIAIAIHNIPEGVCVAMPIYYATGSRWRAFLWAFLSGVSEPIGAFLGWVVLKDIFGPLVYGISFGLIGGMMVYISLKELLPTAHRFDKTKGQLTSVFLVVGMAVMALSIVLFAY